MAGNFAQLWRATLRFDTASFPESEFAGPEPRLFRIVSDVLAVMGELFDVADDVVVGFGLPERAAFSERSVDAPGGEFFHEPVMSESVE